MLEMFKKLFSKSQEKPQEEQEEKIGRTFNRVLTSKYYGLEDDRVDQALAQELKEKKIAQIKALELKPKFARYLYKNESEASMSKEPIAIQVAFQKERYSRKRQMLHVSEMSFIVKAEDFDEFEKKLNISLVNDFKHLPPEDSYRGIERRKEKRPAL